MAMLPPGGALELVFSFDTTGSMSQCTEEVTGRLQDMIQRLQADIPGIRIALLAHGDYCDREHFYVTKYLDLTNDVVKLFEFVRDEATGTGGGDFEECYELMMQMVRTQLTWTAGSQRILVVIGDATPHEVQFYDDGTHGEAISWQDELGFLNDTGVKVYGVQCLNNPEADHFYRTLATRTAGRHLKLNEFSNIFDFIMAICYREKGHDFFEAYEAEVRARDGGHAMHKDLEGLFGALKDPVTPPHSDICADAAKKIQIVHPHIGPLPALKAVVPGPVPVVKAAVPAPAPVVKAALPLTVLKKIPRGDRQICGKWIKRPRNKQPKIKTPLRHFREDVPEAYFRLNELPWSPWKLAITNDPSVQRGAFRKCRLPGPDCNVVSCNTKLYTEMGIPAMYEFSVQLKSRCRRHVVFAYVAKRYRSNPCGILTRRGYLIDTLAELISNGCRVFVRRTVLKKNKVCETRRRVRNLYDYAWSKNKSGQCRNVVKNGVTISR